MKHARDYANDYWYYIYWLRGYDYLYVRYGVHKLNISFPRLNEAKP